MPFSKNSLKYIGGIRTPHEETRDVTLLPNTYPVYGVNVDYTGMGGRPFSIDHVRREFVLGSRYQRVMRLQMVEPQLHQNNDVNTFPIAPYVMPTMVELSGPSKEPNPPMLDKSWFELADPWDTQNSGQGGLLPLNDKILVAGTLYYDANGSQRKAVALSKWPFMSPAHGYSPDRTPFKAVGNIAQGVCAGYLCPVPLAWQARLRGDVLMGQGGLPIITRGSAGPSAIAFYANDVATKDPVPGTFLVGYPSGHWMPGHPWDNPHPDDIYNMATQILGMAVVGDVLVFVGCHGYGQSCYGDGTSVQPTPPGMCYDPSSSAKANHAWPYRLQVWHYPLQDLADVAAGLKEPWSLVPSWFELDVPFIQLTKQPTGCAFDPQTNRLYVGVHSADGYGYEPGPVIYAYEFVEGAVEPPVDPPIDPPIDPPVPPIPPPVDPCTSLQLQVTSLTLSLAAETQRHQETQVSLSAATSKLSAVNSEAKTIIAHNATLKPNSKLPGWCTDAVNRILNLSKA